MRFAIALSLLFATATMGTAEEKKVVKKEEKSVTHVTNHHHDGWKGRAHYGPHRNGYGWGHRGWGWGGRGWGNHSSTAAEGFMRGQGARARGYGQYLRALGEYQNMHQEALRKHYENEDFRIKKYWETKEAWEAEQKRRRDLKHSIDAKHKQLDKVVQRAELEARKTEMRAAGLLPPKRQQAFVFKGKDYGTYAKFMRTEEYSKLLAAVKWKKAMEVAKKRLDAEKHDAAIRFLAERRAMSVGARLRADERSRAISQLRLKLGNSWVEKWIIGQRNDHFHDKMLEPPLPPPFHQWEASHKE